MIKGIPLQTQSTHPSIRGWGCVFSCLAAIAMDVVGRVLSIAHLVEVFNICKARGLIKENAIPVTSPGWYRAFILDAPGVMGAAAAALGRKVSSRLIYKGPKTPTPEGAYTIIKYKTKSSEHYVVGICHNDGSVEITYNPAPTTRLLDLINVRHWQVSL